MRLDDADHSHRRRRDYAGSPARQPRWGANRRARFPAARCGGALRIASAAEATRSTMRLRHHLSGSDPWVDCTRVRAAWTDAQGFETTLDT